jgi:hypothetical protein
VCLLSGGGLLFAFGLFGCGLFSSGLFAFDLLLFAFDLLLFAFDLLLFAFDSLLFAFGLSLRLSAVFLVRVDIDYRPFPPTVDMLTSSCQFRTFSTCLARKSLLSWLSVWWDGERACSIDEVRK